MNPWSNPDALPEADAANLAAFIDARSLVADQAQAHAALVDALNPQPGERLLDAGCGTGVIARRLAALVQPTGSVLGVDISRAMLDFAERQPMLDGLKYQQASASHLPCADHTFDGATAARLLMHVDDPHALLCELRRVVRPAGRLAILEADWGTLAVDHSDRALTRRIVDWRTDTIDGENWMGRQLVRRCTAAGWHVVDVRVLVSIARDASNTLASSLRRCADLAEQHGVITTDERQRWLSEIDQRLVDGAFFATMNEDIVVATR
jgi:SAM-dependent methyltransferase